MVEFIIQYWLQFVLGVAASGLTILCRRFYKLYRKEKTRQVGETESRIISSVKTLIEENNKETMKVIREEEMASTKNDEKIEKQMREIQEDHVILTEGMLSIQGKQFKEDCRELLKEGHVISLNEYEHITHEHDVYNQLHGNHEGDGLYSLVKVKYEASLSHFTE